MDHTDDIAVTRVTVVLSKSEDWDNWLFIRKDTCVKYDVWKYVNPDTPDNKLPVLEKPTKPLFSEAKDAATKYTDLDSSQQGYYKILLDEYQTEYLRYEKQSQAISTLLTDIGRTISKEHIYLIKDLDTARARLLKLKEQLAPNASARKYEIIQKYNALKKVPASVKAYDAWLDRWIYVVAQGQSISLPETVENRPLEDFATTLRAKEPEFAIAILRELYAAEEDPTIVLKSFTSYVAEIRKLWRRTHPVVNLSTHAADIEITKPAGGSSGNNKGNNNNDRAPRRQAPGLCLCGESHWYADCFHLNTKHPKRPAGFRSPANIVNKIKEGRKIERVDDNITRSLKRWEERNNKLDVNIINIDNANDTTQGNTFFTSLSPKLGTLQHYVEPELEPKDSKEAHQVTIDVDPVTLDSPQVLNDPVQFSKVDTADSPVHFDSLNLLCDTVQFSDTDDALSNPVGSDTLVPIDDASAAAPDLYITLPINNLSDYDYSLAKRFILDPGSNTHVINSEDWVGWTRVEDNTTGRCVNAGSSQALIEAYGTMEIVARVSATRLHTLRITQVAYVPGFLTNIIGLSRCRTEGIHFDSGEDLVYKLSPQNTRVTIAQLEYNGGHWLVDTDASRRPQTALATLSSFAARRSYAPRPDKLLTRQQAHNMWGHCSKKAVEHLAGAVNGLSLMPGDFPDCFCDICAQTKLTQIISRRPSDNKATRPFYRLCIDLIYILPRDQQCWNGDRYGLHAADEFSKWQDLKTSALKNKSTLMYWLKCLIRRIQRIYGYDVHVIHTDGERGFGNELQEICSELGMLLEVSPTATHEANGFIEKQNDILTLRARALRISSNLPEDLANECYLTAAYLLNRTPIEALKWKTPYEVIYGRKPLVGHMHPFGCKAYCLNRNLAKANKTASRALIGHLVGYRGTNVFKVYLLGGKRTDPILYTRDAIFDDQKFYTGLDGFEDNEYIREEIELLEYPMPFQEEEVEHEELLTRLQQRRRLLDGPPAHDSSSEHVGGETQDQDQAQHQAQLQTQLHKRPKTPDPQQLLTPEPTDLGGASTTPSPDDDEFTTPTPGPSNRDEYPLAAPPEYRPFGEKAPKDISADFSLGNVVTGKRQRKQPDAFAATLGYINYVPLDGVSLSRNYSDIPHYLSVFTAELTKPAGSVNNDIPRVHQTQLPKPPRFVKDLKDHAYSSGFKVALTKEWLALRSKGCFKSTTLTKATVDAECLPLMWVFTYKIAEDGYLLLFKA
jgi:hypothetical protein